MSVITEGRPVVLDNTADDPTRRAPLALGHDLVSVTDTVCGIVEQPKPPKAWWIAFGISSLVTGVLGTWSHDAVHYGLMGAVIGEIGLPDLNILDAVWINANPYDGPWTSYEGATRVDRLVASADPVGSVTRPSLVTLVPPVTTSGVANARLTSSWSSVS